MLLRVPDQDIVCGLALSELGGGCPQVRVNRLFLPNLPRSSKPSGAFLHAWTAPSRDWRPALLVPRSPTLSSWADTELRDILRVDQDSPGALTCWSRHPQCGLGVFGAGLPGPKQSYSNECVKDCFCPDMMSEALQARRWPLGEAAGENSGLQDCELPLAINGKSSEHSSKFRQAFVKCRN